MKYYDRSSLREHDPPPVDEVLAVGTVVADALAFAHGQGLPTSWVLADFGIARGMPSSSTAGRRSPPATRTPTHPAGLPVPGPHRSAPPAHPAEFAAIIIRCLAKERADRSQGAAELKQALTGCAVRATTSASGQ